MKKLKLLLIILVIICPLIIPLRTLAIGNIGFWYDPARDFLLALNNLQKFSLIGPPAGIPGIFYGPYWIWLLSVSLLFSKDPQWVVFLVLTVPYFIISPIIIFLFRKVWGYTGSFIAWILFVFSSVSIYAVNPWNIYPAPLLFLIVLFIFTFLDFSKKSKSTKYLLFSAGVLSGLIINFHISFGVGVMLGNLLFLLLYFRSIFSILLFLAGAILTFAPFFVFEFRHDFSQIKVLSSTIMSDYAVVGLKGFSKELIMKSFFDQGAKVMRIPSNYFAGVLTATVAYLAFISKKEKIKFQQTEKRMIAYLLMVGASILTVYISSKNPVWAYHFIGVEVIFIFLITLIVSKNKILQKIMLTWISIITAIAFSNFYIDITRSASVDPTSLAAKKNVVKVINEDSSGQDYAVFAYSPSIYQYDYAYLFTVNTRQFVPFDPGQNSKDSKLIYLIVTNKNDDKQVDFISYRTPGNKYKTIKEIKTKEGIVIIKREFIN